MNGIESIKQRINSEAREQAALIRDAAEKEASDIRQAAEAASKKEAAALLEKGRAAADAEEKRIIASLSSELRLEALKKKQAVIDKAFELAQKKIDMVSGPEYEALLVKLITGSSYSGDEEVFFSESDRALAPAVLAAANEALRKEGRRAELTLSPKAAPFSRGVSLRKGITEVNCSLDHMAEDGRDSLTKDVAAMLFG